MANDFPPNAMLRISTDERGVVELEIQRLSLKGTINIFSLALANLLASCGHYDGDTDRPANYIAWEINRAVSEIKESKNLEGVR